MPAVPLIMGFLTGATVFAGLPLAVRPTVTEKQRSFLVSISTGVLVYLFVEICSKAIGSLKDLLSFMLADYPAWWDFFLYFFLFIFGLAVGLSGLIYFGRKFLDADKYEILPIGRAKRASLLIAVEVGLGNLVKGLAIGAVYMSGAHKLSLLLALGFGLHNFTRAFTITAPIGGQFPGVRYLLGLGLVGGLPIFVGAFLGSLSSSRLLEMTALSLAAGAILYIMGELFYLGRRLQEDFVVKLGLWLGFAATFAVEMLMIFLGVSWGNEF